MGAEATASDVIVGSGVTRLSGPGLCLGCLNRAGAVYAGGQAVASDSRLLCGAAEVSQLGNQQPPLAVPQTFDVRGATQVLCLWQYRLNLYIALILSLCLVFGYNTFDFRVVPRYYPYTFRVSTSLKR